MLSNRPAQEDIRIPNDPSLVGQRIYAQGLLVDPWSGAAKGTFTQAFTIQIE